MDKSFTCTSLRKTQLLTYGLKINQGDNTMNSRSLNMIVFLSLQCCFVLNAFAQQRGNVYNWPLKPGMPQWKELKTHDEMLEVLQIPSEMIQKMTTNELAQTCLHYPLFADIWAFFSLQDGMEQVTAGFNGLQELFRREDAGLELVAIYKATDHHNFIESWSILQKGKFAAEFAKIEILLAQEAILSSLNQNERLLLLKESVNKQNAMKQYPMYDMNNQEPNAYLMGKIMLKDNPVLINQIIQQDTNIQEFLQQGSMAAKETINKIVSLAQSIINN